MSGSYSCLGFDLSLFYISTNLNWKSLKQTSMNAKMRANSFAAFGVLSKYGMGALNETFLEQVVANSHL